MPRARCAALALRSASVCTARKRAVAAAARRARSAARLRTSRGRVAGRVADTPPALGRAPGDAERRLRLVGRHARAAQVERLQRQGAQRGEGVRRDEGQPLEGERAERAAKGGERQHGGVGEERVAAQVEGLEARAEVADRAGVGVGEATISEQQQTERREADGRRSARPGGEEVRERRLPTAQVEHLEGGGGDS